MDLINTLTDRDNILAAFVAVAMFATIITLCLPLFKRDNLEGRLKSVANRRDELRRKSREAIASGINGGSALRHSDGGLYKRIVDQLQLTKFLEDPKVADKLAEAGLRGPKPITTFYFFRMVTPVVFFVAAAIYLFGFGPDLPLIVRLGGMLVALMAGYYAPNMYISNAAQKRRDSIVAVFPDALDLLLICVEAGMSIEAAIQKVSQEVGSSSLELAEELTLLTAELSYLPERRMAYEGLAKRTRHPGIKSVATAMIQAERYGTSLGTALRVMARENRQMRMSAAEKKAAALPAKLTVPMIMFFLPVLFVVVLGPAIIQVMDIMG